MYPVLKPSVRMKRQTHSCQIKDIYIDVVTTVHPAQCVILALCNGALNADDIARCAAGAFGASFAKARETVDMVLDKRADKIYWQDEPVLRQTRYNMEEFIYTPEPFPSDGVLKSPVSAVFVLTNHCNYRCIYCYNSSSPERQTEMSTENWLEAVRQLSQTDCFVISLSGGEPMTHPGFYDILYSINNSGMLAEVSTNGSLIDDEAVQRYLDCGQRRVMISLDTADPVKYREMTGSDSFHKVIAAIEKLMKADIHVDIKALLYPGNYTGVAELLWLINGMGIDGVMLDTYKLYAIGRGGMQYWLNDEQCAYVQNVLDTIELKGLGYQFTPPQKRWTCEDDVVCCGGVSEGVLILANGSYGLCERAAGNPYFDIGKFPDTPIMDMWKSGKAKALINPPVEAYCATCRECEVFDKCKSGCLASKQLVGAGTFDVDPHCWKARYENNPLEVFKW